MKKLTRFLAAGMSTAVMLSALALPASAGSLTEEELRDKYGYLCEITEVYNLAKGIVPCASELIGSEEYMPQNGAVIDSGIENGFYYDLLDNDTVRVTGLRPSDFDADTSTLEIPTEIAGLPVTEIGYEAFAYIYKKLPELHDIVIPDSVELIAEGAFKEAFGKEANDRDVPHGIYHINIPQNVKYIGYYAYFRCSRPVAETCPGEDIIVLPESLEYISSQAFDWAIGSRSKGFVTVQMPESLVFMSDSFFHADWISTYPHEVMAEDSISVFSEDFPEEYMPLLLDITGRGFEGGKSNIITMRETLLESLGEPADSTKYLRVWTTTWEDMTSLALCPADDIEGISEEDLEWYRNLPYHGKTTIEMHLEKAALYAPDLIPESIRSEYLYAAQQSKPQEVTLAGDLNVDGKVDIMDAIALARITAEDKEVNVTEAGLSNADVNGDGAVTADDLNALLAQLAG